MANASTPTDSDALGRIRDLVAQEMALQENGRLRRLEVELDLRWDPLGHRRALRETGGDPREAARPADESEGYLG